MAQTAEDRLSNVLFYGVVACLAYLGFRIFEPFLVPLGWSCVFAVLFYALNKKFERKWGRALSAALVTAGVALLLVIPVLLLAATFVHQGIEAARNVQAGMASGAYGWMNDSWTRLMSHIAAERVSADLPGLAREATSRAGQYVASELGAAIRDTVVFLFELFVMLFALFYFLQDGDAMLARLRRFLPFEEATTDRMLAEARELIFASVTTSLVIAAIQVAICSIGFAIAGLGSPVFWGVVAGFLALLPVLGTWPVWVPAAIWLITTGHAGRAILLAAICGGLGVTIDNLVRPALLGGRTSLNGLLVFISVLGGIAVFGVLGIVLGPIVVATAAGILDVYSGREAQTESP